MTPYISRPRIWVHICNLNMIIISTLMFVVMVSAAQAQSASPSTESAILSATEMLANGEAKDAISKLETASADSQSFELCQLLVDAYGDRIEQVNMLKKRGLAKKMLSTMQQCYALDPQDETAQLNLIMFYLEAPSMAGGDKAKAARLIDDISKTHPARGLLMRARLAVTEKDFDTAASLAHDAIEITPDNTEALSLAGLIAIQQNQYEEAMTFFKRCISIDVQNMDCHYQIGKTAQLSGTHTQDGIAAFQLFIENGHSDAEYLAHAHYRLAELLITANQTNEARSHLQKAVELADIKPAKKRLRTLGAR